jgi:hypothetical protein
MPSASGATTNKPTTSNPPPSGRGGGSLERVTVNLTERSAEELAATAALTTETRTDVINKAVQLYAFLRKLHDSGGAIYIREPGSKEPERVRLL